MSIINEKTVLSRTENAIQKLLLELDEELISFGTRVDHIEVDTRNFANMKTEIHTVVETR